MNASLNVLANYLCILSDNHIDHIYIELIYVLPICGASYQSYHRTSYCILDIVQFFQLSYVLVCAFYIMILETTFYKYRKQLFSHLHFHGNVCYEIVILSLL